MDSQKHGQTDLKSEIVIQMKLQNWKQISTGLQCQCDAATAAVLSLNQRLLLSKKDEERKEMDPESFSIIPPRQKILCNGKECKENIKCILI